MTVHPGQATANLAEQMLAKIKAGEGTGEPMPPKRDQAMEDFAPRTPPGPRPLEPIASMSGDASGAVTAADLIDENAPWLPADAERRTVFLQVFRYWHAQVRPQSAAKARPAFLFLVTSLPMMVKARDELVGLNLWEPPGEASRQARDAHAAWRRYCELLPRAQQALGELDTYRHLSLVTALDELVQHILQAEVRFREGAPQKA